MKTTKQPSGLFVLFLLLLIGGAVWFFSAAEKFYHFTNQTVQTSVAAVPRSKQLPVPAAEYDTDVKYRTFFLTAPGAEKVELQADFNRWGKDPISLTAYKQGYFETSVALAKGDYKYTFVVDGKETPDPTNLDRKTLEDGREVCIKTVR